MTALLRCELSDLLVEQCGCRIHRAAVVETDIELNHTRRGATFGRAVTARYPGRCPGCGDHYDVGDLIRFDNSPTPASNSRWWHNDCAEETI